MLKPIVFWGASGHAKVLRECLHRSHQVIALFDNDPQLESPFPGVNIYHGQAGFQSWLSAWEGAKPAGLPAIGGARGRDRLQILALFETAGLNIPQAIHAEAFVAADARLGKGTQVLAKAAVCSEVSLGAAGIINTSASVDHECVLGDGVHVAPGAVLAGCVSVGDGTLIGAGAVVLPRVRVGRDVVVGAGSIVTKDVADGQLVQGNPARVRGEKDGD